MKIFTIDNTIEGLLCALFYSFTEKIVPDNVENKKIYQPSLDSLTINILTSKAKSERVKIALFKYGGDDIIAHIKVCLSSCAPNALSIAFFYAHYMLESRTDVSTHLDKKCVSDFSYIVQRVLHERHILTGFLRFKESAGGVLYAQYSPDNDVTYLLAPHFLRRLGHLPFIIHDVKRKKIAISDGRSIKIDYTDIPVCFTPSEQESACNDLWHRYYNTINIKERQNLRQRTTFFPHRYRNFAFETWE